MINTLKGLPGTKIDAALALSALILLYLIRGLCTYMAKKQPGRKKLWFFISTLRIAFVILLFILISYLANRGIINKDHAKFKILGSIPSGKSTLES